LSVFRLNTTYKRMALAHPFFLLLAVLLSYQVSATSVYNQTVRQAYNETIKLRIAKGRSLIRKELQANPGNAVALLIANQQDFLTWSVQQDPSVFDELLKRQEKRLLTITSLKERSAWVDYSLAEVRLQIALSKLLNGQKIAAAWDLRQAYLQYLTNAKRYPDFLPNRKTLGALQVLVGSVPDTYKVFLNIIGMKGDLKTGMANLKAAASHENPFQEEAILLQALILHLLDRDPDKQAAITVRELAISTPDNLLYSFVAMHILKKTKQSDLALSVYQQKPTGNNYLAFPYLHHMAADLYLYKGNFAASIRENSQFLEQHKGNHYFKAAHFKLYLANWLGQQKQAAMHHYRLISTVGKADVEEDAYAQRFVSQQSSPNRYLMLARLQSDGGYNQEALQVLNQMKLSAGTAPDERAEYFYRKARIYHGMEDLSQAKQYYQQAIDACQNTTLYFAPYAALQLGYIYQDEHKPDTAKAWFTKALSYKGHDYKNSIDGKAKLALQTL
jgi:hypothetical protein